MAKKNTENAPKNLNNIVKSIQDIMRQDAGVDGDAQRLSQMVWLLFLKVLDGQEDEFEVKYDDYVSPIPENLRWRNWATNDEEGNPRQTAEELLELINNELIPTFRDFQPETESKRERGVAHVINEVFRDTYNYMKNGVLLKKVIGQIDQIDFNSRQEKHLFNDIYEQMLRDLQSAGNSGEFYTPRAVTEFMTQMVDPKIGEIILDPACGTGGFLVNALEYVKSKGYDADQLPIIHQNIRGFELKSLPYSLAITNLLLHEVELPQLEHQDSFAKPLASYDADDRVHVIMANPPFGGTVDDKISSFSTQFKTKETADLFLVLIVELLREGGRAALVLPDGSLSGDGVKARVRQNLLENCNLHTIVRLDNSVFKPYASVKTNLLFFEKGTPTKEVWYYKNPLPEGTKSYGKTKTIQLRDFDGVKTWWNNRTENEFAYKVGIEQIKTRNFDLDIKHPNEAIEEVLESPNLILNRMQGHFEILSGLMAELRKI